MIIKISLSGRATSYEVAEWMRRLRQNGIPSYVKGIRLSGDYRLISSKNFIRQYGDKDGATHRMISNRFIWLCVRERDFTMAEILS